MKDCFTTLEQSAKLIELGLDICTADGYRNGKNPTIARTIKDHDFNALLKRKKATKDKLYPCWSALRLIELMPPVVQGFISDYRLVVNRDGVWYEAIQKKPGYNHFIYDGEGDDIIAKLVDVIEMLKKNNDFQNE
jgi:hypothetical protein